jgi:diguanylate cyclase (GGDEF)-like protein
MGNHPNKRINEADTEEVSAALSLLDELPPLHAAVHQLFAALANDDIDRSRLAAVIDQCPSLASRLVGLANSAYFRRRSAPISSISDAVFVLGFRTVRSLATASALQEPFSNNRCPAFQPGRFWLHATLTAHIARELARKTTVVSLNPDETYLAGLLHGVGLLALAHLFPEELERILERSGSRPDSMAGLIRDKFGVDHRCTGSALLSRWHLPELFCCVNRNYADSTYQGEYWVVCRIVAVSRAWAERVIHQEETNTLDQVGLNVLGITQDTGDTITATCLEQVETLSELAELISGEKPVFCEPELVEDAAVELKDCLVNSIESLSSLSELTELDIKERDERSLLRGALEVLMKNQNMQRCSVFLMEDGRLVNAAGLSWVELNTACAANEGVSGQSHEFALGEGLVGIAAETGKIQHCRDCSADPRFKQIRDGEDAAIGSLISVPIRFRERTLGVINVSHRYTNVFGEWDERFLAVFCNLLGQLITSNQLLRNMDHEIKQRTMELQVALERAESLSILDGLTGVHNRRYFINHFATLIEQCARYRHGMALMMIDIDDFKNINDEFGHLEGDRILKNIAGVLSHCARGADIIARFGGEEFIIALQDTDCEGANHVAGRIQDQVRGLYCGSGQGKRNVTVSIGVACYRQAASMPVKTPEQWIQEADDALYRAKRGGKNRVSVYVCDDQKNGPV